MQRKRVDVYYHGVKENNEMIKPCRICQGTGNCQECGGSGTSYKTALFGATCPSCGGTGDCKNCNGTGKIRL